MKRIFSIVTLMVLFYGVNIADELKKLGLDDTSTLGLRIQTNSNKKTEGKGSLKISTRWPVTVCLAEVTGIEIENATLVYQAKVRSKLNGDAFLEMWAHVNGGQYFSKRINDPVRGKSEWKSIRTIFNFQQGQKPEKVILNPKN